jgi:transcriptional regulator with XRE-family HTH domain
MGVRDRADNQRRMGVLNEVGERLVRLRTQAGLEPEAAATASGIPADRLTDAEEGEVALTETEIGALASTYGVDPTEIFGGRITPFRDYAGGA